MFSTLEDSDDNLFGLDGEFLCAENCIPDNGPLIDYTRMVWSVDGVNEAPAGVGLEPGIFPDDPGCASAGDWTETSPLFPCDDAADNDSDGLTDYPDDSGCGHPYQIREDPQCDDGVDNDGDFLIDFPNDPGCASGAKREAPQCHDGVDNDSDGDIDEADSYCLTAAGVREGRIACGIGFELALIVPLLGAAARRRRAAAARVAAARRR